MITHHGSSIQFIQCLPGLLVAKQLPCQDQRPSDYQLDLVDLARLSSLHFTGAACALGYRLERESKHVKRRAPKIWIWRPSSERRGCHSFQQANHQQKMFKALSVPKLADVSRKRLQAHLLGHHFPNFQEQQVWETRDRKGPKTRITWNSWVSIAMQAVKL